MNNNLSDLCSVWLSKSIDILFLTHRKRTALGFIVGATLYIFLSIILKPLISTFKSINLADLVFWHYLIIGVFIMHIPTIIECFKQKTELPHNIEQALAMINQAEASGIPKSKIRTMRLELCNSLVKAINKDPNETQKSDKQFS